jgi:N-acetylglucosaminyl-diphospho-decaprenol L-rhamnosyltransferase
VPAIAAAVVSWNTRELLARGLERLAGDARVETWVVDNASTDGSAEMVRARFPDVRLIASEENLGFGAAVSRVAAQTSAPWLLIANADAAPRPGALDALLAAGERDPGAGALAPRLLLPDGGTQHSVLPFPSVPFTLAFNLGLLRGRLGDRLVAPGAWDPGRERRVPWAIAAFLLVRRQAWDAAGGFDPEQWMYAEDLDLGWRLRAAGWATRYVPAAEVEHDEGAAAAKAWGEAATERRQRSTYAWMLRRRGAVRTRAVATLNVAGAGIRAALLAPLAGVAGGRWARSRAYWAWWARVHRTGLEPRRRLSVHR